MKTLSFGLTGEGGSIYGLRLISELAKRAFRIRTIATKMAGEVITCETGHVVKDFISDLNKRWGSK